MIQGKDIVILTSLSFSDSDASCIDDQDQWLRHHTNKILGLRQYLQKNLSTDVKLALDHEIYHNPDWHLNLIGPQTTVIIVVNLGLISFYQSPDRMHITEEDRHTNYVVSFIRSFESNSHSIKRHIFVTFEKYSGDKIPVLWHYLVKNLIKDEDYSTLISVIRGGIFTSTYLNESMPHLITNKEESDFINYWKNIFLKDRSHLLSIKYFIDRNLSHQPISQFESFEKALKNDNVDKSLKMSELYTLNCDFGKSEVILIHGAVGSGKSTNVQILSHLWAKGESLTMFRAVIPIKINENNMKCSLTELVNFVQFEFEDTKKKILNGFLKTPGKVLYIFDIENYPWREWNEFFSSELGKFILNNKSQSILVFTNPLSYTLSEDKQLMNNVDIIYELQGFNHDQLRQFFRKRKWLIDMKCSEIFQELCKHPLYATMIPHNNYNTEYSNLTSFCKAIVEETILKNTPKELSKNFSLDSLDEYPTIKYQFARICDLAWEFVHNGTNMGEQIFDLSKNTLGGLGFIDLIAKPNDNRMSTPFFLFRLTTIQYFLAAFHFVHFLCAPDINRDFLSDIGQCHTIHYVWRFITGLLTDVRINNRLLETLGGNHAPQKLQYIQAISESGLKFSQVEPALKGILSTWINSFKWEKVTLYPSDCLAIVTAFKYLDVDQQSNILTDIQDVYFSNCNLDNEGMFHLIEVLSKFRNVRHINVGGNPNLLNPLSRNGCVGYINEILKNNCCTLTELFISSSGLTNAGLRILQPTFLKLKNLKQLDLSRNTDIGQDGWEIFSSILRASSLAKLSKLFLADNKIDQENLYSILLVLSNYNSLTWLNLSGNKLNEISMKYLIRVLLKNKLRKLFLSNCCITNLLLKILIEFIKTQKNEVNDLVSLALSWNKFDNDIMKDLMESLTLTNKLQKLMLDNNRIGSETSMEILSNSLSQMTNLGELSISKCSIGDNGASRLSQASKHVTIDLRKNNIENPGKIELHSHTILK